MSNTADKNASGTARRAVGWRVRWFFHLLVLWSFAVAQPLFAKISENLPFLLAHRLGAAHLVVYALGLALLPPLLLWAGVGLTSMFWRRLAGILQRLIVVALIALALLPIAMDLGLPEKLAAALALSLALIPGFFYHTRLWTGLLDFLVPAPFVFAAVFLFFGPASALLFSGDQARPLDQAEQDDLDIPVVVVLLDEMPTQAMLDADGRLDHRRLPGFARLAEVSTWYPRATTVVEATVMAAPVLLSGILPTEGRHQPPVYQNFPENIFDQVSPQRRIRAVENGSRLCRPGRCDYGLDRDDASRIVHWKALVADTVVIWGHITLPASVRARWLPELGTRWAGFAPVGDTPASASNGDGPRKIRWGQRQSEFAAFLESLGGVGPATMYFQHLLLPHAPWIYLPDGRAYDVSRSDSISGMMPERANNTGIKHMWWDSQWATVLGEQRFHLQLGYVDSLLDSLLDRLAESGYFDELMLVVAADHGGAFTPGTSRRALTAENFAEILPIPLFIKYPGQTEGRIDERPAELLDVSPTIRRALGLAVDGLDGRALQDEAGREFRPRLVNEHGEHFEFSQGEFQRGFDAALRRTHQRLAFSAPDGFVMIADYQSAYGQQPQAWGQISAQPSELRLAAVNADYWESYLPGEAFAPARFLGRLEGAAGGDVELAITLNGRIAGFTRPFRYPGANGLVEAMLWPKLLKPGSNELAAWEVVAGKSRPLLLEVQIDAVHAAGADRDAAAGLSGGAAKHSTTESDDQATAPDIGDTHGMSGQWFFPAAITDEHAVALSGAWHKAGQEIRWVGQDAGVCFELDDPATELAFEFRAIPFLHPPAVSRQRLQVEVNGRKAATLVLEESKLGQHRVDLGVVEPGLDNQVCLAFHFPDARVPHEVGASPDRRVLGAAFLKFRLIEKEVQQQP